MVNWFAGTYIALAYSMGTEFSFDNTIVYACQYHVVFCPKYRKRLLIGGIGVRLKELLLEKQNAYNYLILDMEVMPEHIHLLMCVSPQTHINNVLAKIKGYTSYRLRQEYPALKRLSSLWTRSKFVSTVGGATLEVVKKYIEGQKTNGTS